MIRWILPSNLKLKLNPIGVKITLSDRWFNQKRQYPFWRPKVIVDMLCNSCLLSNYRLFAYLISDYCHFNSWWALSPWTRWCSTLFHTILISRLPKLWLGNTIRLVRIWPLINSQSYLSEFPVQSFIKMNQSHKHHLRTCKDNRLVYLFSIA